MKEVISQQYLFQHLSEFVTVGAETVWKWFGYVCACITPPHQESIPPLSSEEPQPLKRRRKSLFVPSLNCLEFGVRGSKAMTFRGNSNVIPVFSPVRRHTLLHSAYSVLTVAKKSSSRRLICANGIILWQMEMICSKQHPTPIGK